MRYLLGHYNSNTLSLELDCDTKGIVFNTTVDAYYCGNCGTESIGAIIYAKDTVLDLKNVRGFGPKKIAKRNNALNEAKEISNSMHEIISNSRICPMCGKTFLEETKGFHSHIDGFTEKKCFYNKPYKYQFNIWMDDVNYLFRKMEKERKEFYINDSKDLVSNITDKANKKHLFTDSLAPKTTEITSSTQNLLQYIAHLMHLEVGLYAIQQNLIELYKGKTELRVALTNDFQGKIEKNHYDINKHKEELRKFEEIHDSFVTITKSEIEIPDEPQKPTKPVFTEVPPEEPIYKTPGLFNKKKVAAENEALKKAYETALEHYQQKKTAYNSKLDNYKDALLKYETAEAAWLAEVEAIKEKSQREHQAAVDKKESEYNEKLSEIKSRLQETETKQQEVIDSIVSSCIDNQAGIQFFEEEISNGEQLLERIVAARNELYSYNVIYPKYRNLVALSSFYDYLMSGRCIALAGPDGAYNLYESESRADLIITKLSDVLTALDKIQENQYMLYQQMSEINDRLYSLNESMTSVVSSLSRLEATGDEMKEYLKSINAGTENISTNVKSISENTEITAHYSKVSAFYAKQNAELTNALGFLVALK